jgi:D-alanine-D-alanine ligase
MHLVLPDEHAGWVERKRNPSAFVTTMMGFAYALTYPAGTGTIIGCHGFPSPVRDYKLTQTLSLQASTKKDMSVGSRKITVGLLFGGRSAEHEVSKASAANVLSALDPTKYNTVLIGLARDGRWLLCNAANRTGTAAAALTIPEDSAELAIAPGRKGGLLRFAHARADQDRPPHLDVIFPVLHGPNGEDGTVQGALELADIAYVGSSVMGSAAAMDKDVAKRLMRDAELPIVPFTTLVAETSLDHAAVVRAVGSTDLFVKPTNLGSSVGISRARSPDEFARSCALASRYDRKIIVERCVDQAREIECSVLEHDNGELRTSSLGEIVPTSKHGFYSYEAKYTDAEGAKLVIPADITIEQQKRMKMLAIESFRVLGCEGMARVDFFLKDEEIFVNEVNTLPGFTSISMYPKLWAASGISYPDLIDRLIQLALERRADKDRTSFSR